MLKITLFRFVIISIITFSLSACGGKGIDRKLDYSGTAEEIGEDYGNALLEAAPEQQNLMRRRIYEFSGIIEAYARGSNPLSVEANAAKENNEQYAQIQKMTIREFFTWYLDRRISELKNEIAGQEEFKSGNFLKIEKVDIDIEKSRQWGRVFGTLTIRNESKNFDYDVRNFELFLLVDGIKTGKASSAGPLPIEVGGNGGATTFEFGWDSDNATMATFQQALDYNQLEKIGFAFDPSSLGGYITPIGKEHSVIHVNERSERDARAVLEQALFDLALLKK